MDLGSPGPVKHAILLSCGSVHEPGPRHPHRQALNDFIRFNDMVKRLREDIQTAYGGVWQCVVAEEGHVAFSFRHLDSPYLYIAFGKAWPSFSESTARVQKGGHIAPTASPQPLPLTGAPHAARALHRLHASTLRRVRAPG